MPKHTARTTPKNRKTAHIFLPFFALSVAAVVFMAYKTYGNNAHIVKKIPHLVPVEEAAQDRGVSPQRPQSRTVPVGVQQRDMDRVPPQSVIDDILNDALPHVCDDCDDDILDCLYDYRVDYIFVRDAAYADKLILRVMTGKRGKDVYDVVIRLDDYTVVEKHGKVSSKKCTTKKKKKKTKRVEQSTGVFQIQPQDDIPQDIDITKEYR